MIAEELVREYPLVKLDTPALEAVRLMGERGLPGLVVVDRDGLPTAILAGYDVLRFVVPGYVVADPKLAAALDEEVADRLLTQLQDKTVKDLLPTKPKALPCVNPEDTVLEVASLMASRQTSIVAVMGRGGRFLGVVTASQLFALAGRP